jgi:crotonobetainyl-CoA:carnitine CoA-transferase CaiB-like acyl-CoA transferase
VTVPERNVATVDTSIDRQMPEGILDGLRVVDLSWGLSGPVATQILAEAGADVIKVEPPGGDPVRSMAPQAFATWNRSKRSVALFLHREGDRAQLHRLLASADVLVHGLRPSKASALGLDDESLVARYPRLVVSSVLGYPVGHLAVEQPGYDILVQAYGGLMDAMAAWRDGPILWRFPAPSWGAAYLAVSGILARLLHRERSGRGGAAHTSLFQGLLLTVNLQWIRVERPSGSVMEGGVPFPNLALYECSNGKYLQIMNPSERIDISELPLTQKVLAEMGETGSQFDAALMTRAMRQATSDEWLEGLRAADVAVELVVPLGEILRQDHVIENGFAVDVDDPTWGRTRQAGPPFQMSPPLRVRGAAPRLGEHSGALEDIATPAAPGGRPSGASPRRPLDGLKVLDFGAFLAGPLAPMLLGDLGADVIKVEPLGGDPMRGFKDNMWEASNRGKRGLAVDLSRPEGQEVLRRLVGWADVVHHNFRSRVARKLGLDIGAIRAIKPDVVFGHVSAYGAKGPRTEWSGYDSVFQAMAGWELEYAGETNPPMFCQFGTLDVHAAMTSLVATLLALYERERTGRATATTASLLNAAVFTVSETLLRLDDDQVAPYPRLTQDQTGLDPGYRIYQVADGWVAVAALEDTGRAALRAVAGVEGDSGIPGALASRTVDDVLGALHDGGVPAERVREFNWFNLLDDTELRAARLTVGYPHARYGWTEQVGAFWTFPDLELKLDRAGPVIGQHSREVLADLGYATAEIDALHAAGVVGSPESSA